ncbi:MAG: hypothetical protein ACYC09_14010 [Bacteroidota bacterium]
MILTASQMRILARLDLDFIGWQQHKVDHPMIRPIILCNDRQNGNATYAFEADASPMDILLHTVEKRKEFMNSHNTGVPKGSQARDT